jgi:hypothetical protein
MNKINQDHILALVFVLIPVVTLFAGFYLNEDLSTGGSRWDFNITWPLIVDYSNFNFLDARLAVVADAKDGAIPRHLPLHYFILSVVYKILNDQNFVRLFYLFFSLLLPIFLYLNLIKIYNCKKIFVLIVSFSFLFLPYFRSLALWPNAHLTALIFFIISNFFYLRALDKDRLFDKVLNLLFLAFATYSLQTYVILFIFYLTNYFLREKRKVFINLFLFCCFLGLPGLYILSLNEKMLKLPITKDLFYSITNNFSIIFFFLLFFLFNKNNYKVFLNQIRKLKVIETTLILFLFVLIAYNLDYSMLTSKLRGGGFFYKISHFIFSNNIIFLSSFFFSLFAIFLLIREDFKFFYIIILINIMGLNYQIYQKYFEPLLLIMIFILFKNFLSANIFLRLKNVLLFYLIIVFYYFLSLINFYYGFSYNMVI